MGNFKIKVNSEAESKEVQELFFKSGGKWCLGGCKIKNTDEPYLYLENGLVLHGSSAETFNTEQHKEITLPELRAMVNDQYAEIEQVRDNVNNPQHYNKGGVECIDAIEASMTPEAFKGYLKGNVQKYMWRYEQKGGVESLRKAQWYLERLVASMGS